MINVSGCGKSNALLHVISHETDIDQIYLHAKDPYETKHQFLIISFDIMILKLLLNTQIIWMMFIKILNSTI